MFDPGPYRTEDTDAKADPIPVRWTIFRDVVRQTEVTKPELVTALGNLQDTLTVNIEARLASDAFCSLNEDSQTWYVHIPNSLWEQLYVDCNGRKSDDMIYAAAQECHVQQVQHAHVVADCGLASLSDRHPMPIAKPTWWKQAQKRATEAEQSWRLAQVLALADQDYTTHEIASLIPVSQTEVKTILDSE